MAEPQHVTTGAGLEVNCLSQQGLDPEGLRASVGHLDYLEGHEKLGRFLGRGQKPSLALGKERTCCAHTHTVLPLPPTLRLSLMLHPTHQQGLLALPTTHIQNLTISQPFPPPWFRAPLSAWTAVTARSLACLPPPPPSAAWSPCGTQGDISKAKVRSSPSCGSSSHWE